MAMIRARMAAQDSSRRGHQFRGECGSRVSFAACRGGSPGNDRSGGPSRGGRWPVLPVGRRAGPFPARVAGRCVREGTARGWRGGPAPHRSRAKWCRGAPISNEKTPRLLASNATNKGASHAKQPPDRSGDCCNFKDLRPVSWRRLHARRAGASQPPCRVRRSRRPAHRRGTCCRPRCG